MNRAQRLGILLALSVAAVAVALTFPPIAQDPEYHQFADRIAFLGIPNFGNVISNLVFIVVGLLGMRAWGKHHASSTNTDVSVFFLVSFSGVILTGLGSGYYHWNPNDATLLWDRLPITLVVMSIFALVVAERIHLRTGQQLLGPLLALGVLSVLYWVYTESLGRGDLRFYALVQFLPMLLIPIIFFLFPARFSHSHYLWHILGWYALAKVFEHFDADVFNLTGHTLSGHSLKHLVAGAAIYFLLRYMEDRRPLDIHISWS